jgi:hypothetical protein
MASGDLAGVLMTVQSQIEIRDVHEPLGLSCGNEDAAVEIAADGRPSRAA